MTTQLMKAVATLSASNATKRANGKVLLLKRNSYQQVSAPAMARVAFARGSMAQAGCLGIDVLSHSVWDIRAPRSVLRSWTGRGAWGYPANGRRSVVWRSGPDGRVQGWNF